MTLVSETPASTTFADLGLSERVQAAVEAAGYTTPTPIQAQAIPHVIARADVIGVAQTGTGKTASFVLPMLTRLENGRARARMPRTLILEPTRELAAQVVENFNKYGINSKLSVALLIGGVSFDDQEKKLDRGVDVLIVTPGRLLDHFERGKLLLTGVEILVIDEADRMLDMGFIPDIERICKLIPATRQTLMFSATMPPEIKRLADAFLRNPVRVEVAKPATTAKTVTQRLVSVPNNDWAKRETLRTLLRQAEDLKNAIVFCNRKRDVATLARSLEKHGFNVGALHGDMDQRARMQTLDAFRANRLTVLVASDVAARGLDIPDVSHVYNYDTPIHSEDYVHRIGRTGRAGRSGTALTLVTPADSKYLGAIEKLTGDKIEWINDGKALVSAPTGGDGDEAAPRVRGGRDGRRGAERRPPRGERPERTERTERSEPMVRPERVERAERTPRPERAARPVPVEAMDEGVAPAERKRAPRGPDAGRRPPRGDGFRPDQARGPAKPQRQSPVVFGGKAQGGSDADADVVGLGDHVPAFLLRPVKVAR